VVILAINESDAELRLVKRLTHGQTRKASAQHNYVVSWHNPLSEEFSDLLL
jgi:hypothetical protein